MRHFPATHGPAQIERAEDLAAGIARDARRMFWIGVGQSVLCGVLGLIAGIALALGYAADVLPWLGR